jgi:hypothetical protein
MAAMMVIKRCGGDDGDEAKLQVMPAKDEAWWWNYGRRRRW